MSCELSFSFLKLLLLQMLLLLLHSLATGKISVNLDLILKILLLQEEVAAVAEPVDDVEDEEQERHRN